jgi:UDP-N-acetyl-D-galactosamine dehydrogenase
MNKVYKIGIIGLGYVGLPLAVEFGKKYKTIGFDINKRRISELQKKNDRTLEVTKSEMSKSKLLQFTNQSKDLIKCNTYIITVPTPIYNNKNPNLFYIKKATLLVASLLKKNDLVIYESTVYPGATEEFCVPIIEKKSKLIFNKDFFCGYSPERINPGDKKHRIPDIIKVTSGSNKRTLLRVDKLYKSIIKAGTHPASSIKIAEAAKVIENIQRDVNIALINELSSVFNLLKIDTFEVLEAAKTKWNFLPFEPGLVGGHCIGIDPYYLTYKSKMLGYEPQMILAGRNINDNVSKVIFKRIKKLIDLKVGLIRNPRILIFGLTFKENCPDTRNSLVFNIIKLFYKNNFIIDVIDPYINLNDHKNNDNFNLIKDAKNNKYNAILLAVGHDQFKKIKPSKLLALGKKDCIIFDAKNILPKDVIDGSL